ncbi:MAG: hypothetical protein AAFQ94_26965 [Bacteroidota bacterium]
MLVNIRLLTSITFMVAGSFLISCTDDENSTVPETTTFEATTNINPANFPAGVGLDLSAGDTGRVASLDLEPNIQWDISVITIRTGAGGRPGVFLFGDTETTGAVQGAKVSMINMTGIGLQAFENFEIVTTQMQDSLSADGVFAFDPQTDIDADGKPDAERLKEEYKKLVIGDKGIRRPEAEQEIYLIRDRNSDYYKFQFVELANGGNIRIRWAKFDAAAIE